MPSRPVESDEIGTLAAIAAAFLLVWVFWDWAFMSPLKTLVLFFHEAGHGLGAWLTGGRINSLVVGPGGGHASYQGGNDLVVTSAGWLGSFAWGAGLIVLSSWTGRARWISAALGLLIGWLTLLYMSNLFGFMFGMLAAAALLSCARGLGHEANDFVLKFVGAASCAYALSYLKADLLSSKHSSDAQELAGRLWLPAKVVALGWFLLGLAGLYAALSLAAWGARRRKAR